MRNFLRYRVVQYILGAVAILALFFVLLPVGIKYYLIDWLEKNGAESASIEKLSYNPFLGRITLEGLDVEGEKRSILHHSRLVIDVGITSLFKRDIRVEHAEYRDLFIDVEQYKDGSWRYGSYTAAGEQEKKVLDRPPGKTSPSWGFHADNVLANNCTLQLKTPELDLTLLIEQAELNSFTTREGEKAGALSLKGRIDDSPFTLQLDTLQIIPEIRADGNIDLANFNLRELAQLLEDVLPIFNGVFGLNGTFHFTMADAKGIEADYDGTVAIDTTNIGSVDFKTTSQSFMWDGSLRYVSPPGNEPVQIATDGLLAVRDLALQLPAADLSLHNSRIDLQGKTLLTITDDIRLEHDGSLSLQGIDLQQPAFGYSEENFSWQGQVAYKAAESGNEVRTTGELVLGGIHLNTSDQDAPLDIQGKKISWNGTAAVLETDAGKQTTLEIHGDLLADMLHSSIMTPPLLLDQDRLSVQTTTTVALGEKLDITGQSSVALDSFRLQQGEDTEALSIGFERLTIAELTNSGGKSISVDELRTDNTEARIPGNLPLKVSIPEIRLENLHTEDLATVTAGSFELEKLQAISAHNGRQLASLEKLTLKNIDAENKPQLAAEDIQLTNLALLHPKEETDGNTFLSLASANVNGLSWGEDAGLQGDTLNFQDLVMYIDRDKNGQINFNRQLQAMQLPTAEVTKEQAAAEAGPEPDARAATSPPIRFQEITIGGNSNIFFTDQTLAVPYSTSLEISRFFIKELDSGQPEKQANLHLEGELEKTAPLKVSGSLAPFQPKPDINLDLVLKNYPLSSLSPYTVQSVGTALASGQLQVTSRMAMADDRIDLKNSVVLRKLKTKTISPELAAELDNQLPIPLDAALAMLRDSDQNITLDIPISGPLDDISVGITQIIITALNESIVSAASSYFVYALGPYAALAYVGMKVGEQMLQVDLPPVIFQPQDKNLTEEHNDYLERIARILTDRPETDLQLSPHVAAWELDSKEKTAASQGKPIELSDAKRKQLMELGQQRATAIKKYLIHSHGIDTLRLLISNTVIEKGKDAQPQVLLEVR